MMRFLILGVLALLGWTPQTSWADAAAPAPECVRDTDCPAEEVCNGQFCSPAERVCASTDQCASGEICDFSLDACPSYCGSDCPERCVVPNGNCIEATPACTADTDCEDFEICLVWGLPICQKGDALCEQTAFYGCSSYARFCNPEQANADSCYQGDVCNQHGRCVAPHLLEASEKIVMDAQHDEAVRLGSDDDRSGCSVAPTGPLSAPGRIWSLLGLWGGLVLLLRRGAIRTSRVGGGSERLRHEQLGHGQLSRGQLSSNRASLVRVKRD